MPSVVRHPQPHENVTEQQDSKIRSPRGQRIFHPVQRPVILDRTMAWARKRTEGEGTSEKWGYCAPLLADASIPSGLPTLARIRRPEPTLDQDADHAGVGNSASEHEGLERSAGHRPKTDEQ